MDYKQYYEENLEGDVQELCVAICHAPLDAQQKNALALTVATKLMGTAMGVLAASDPELSDVPMPEMCKAVADMVIAQMESTKAKSKN